MLVRLQPLAQIHHIDEDPTNNKEENLILLCPNCHALADSKNTRKGNGRRYERQKFRDETNNLFTGAHHKNEWESDGLE